MDFPFHKELQSFLDEKGIVGLTNIKIHDVELGRTRQNEPYDEKKIYILNYEKILDPAGLKDRDPVLCQCRNTIVRNNKILASSFVRFLNLSEEPEKLPEWEKILASGECLAYEKFDGSLITVTYFDDKWWTFTRGSLADNNVFGSHKGVKESNDTYGSRVRKLLDFSQLDTSITYVFELCDPLAYITKYDDIFLGIIAANKRGHEIDIRTLVLPKHIRYPEMIKPNSIKELDQILSKKKIDFEGYVLTYQKDNKIFRAKYKTKIYLQLHKDHGSLSSPACLIERVLQGDAGEIVSHFPEFEPQIAKILNALEIIQQQAEEFMTKYSSATMAEFGKAAVNFYASWILFDVKRGKYPTVRDAMFFEGNMKKMANAVMTKLAQPT